MSISRPSLNFQIVPDTPTPDVLARRTLIVGQKLLAGSTSGGQLIQDIQNNNQQDALFGAGSQLAAMVQAFKLTNELSPLDVIVLEDDGGATAATGQIQIVGAATSTGSVEVVTGSQRYNTYDVQVTSGDANTVIADAIALAINNDDSSPVTAVSALGNVDLTAKNGGEVGNSITISILCSDVTGIQCSVVGMASGATNPSLTGIFDVVGNTRYTSVVAPYEYGTTFLKDFLQPRFNSDNIVLDGVGFQATHDTYANLLTAASGVNSQSNVIIGVPDANPSINDMTEETVGSAISELDYVVSSYYAALRELRLFEGAQISNIVSAGTGSLDKFGGPAIAGLPYFNTPFEYLPLIRVQDEFTDAELNALRDANISMIGNNRNRTSIIMSDAVTTYVADSIGNPDVTFKFLNAVDISSISREVFFNRAKEKFSQSRLTSQLVSGYSNATPESIRAFFTGTYQDLAGTGFNLVQGSQEAIAFYKQNLTVDVVDFAQGIVDVTMKLPINSQVRVIDATLSINLSLIN